MLCSEAGMLPNELAGWCSNTSRVSTSSTVRVPPRHVLAQIAHAVMANPLADWYARLAPVVPVNPAVAAVVNRTDWTPTWTSSTMRGQVSSGM